MTMIDTDVTVITTTAMNDNDDDNINGDDDDDGPSLMLSHNHPIKKIAHFSGTESKEQVVLVLELSTFLAQRQKESKLHFKT